LIERVGFAADPPPEGCGFEPSVPLQALIVSRPHLVVSVTVLRFHLRKTEITLSQKGGTEGPNPASSNGEPAALRPTW
jgi:hypothetical protein